jgi:hypothetical protein
LAAYASIHRVIAGLGISPRPVRAPLEIQLFTRALYVVQPDGTPAAPSLSRYFDAVSHSPCSPVEPKCLGCTRTRTHEHAHTLIPATAGTACHSTRGKPQRLAHLQRHRFSHDYHEYGRILFLSCVHKACTDTHARARLRKGDSPLRRPGR